VTTPEQAIKKSRIAPFTPRFWHWLIVNYNSFDAHPHVYEVST
jgi:hypothetical protein